MPRALAGALLLLLSGLHASHGGRDVGRGRAGGRAAAGKGCLANMELPGPGRSAARRELGAEDREERVRAALSKPSQPPPRIRSSSAAASRKSGPAVGNEMRKVGGKSRLEMLAAGIAKGKHKATRKKRIKVLEPGPTAPVRGPGVVCGA